jgi:hypothetical protein
MIISIKFIHIVIQTTEGRKNLGNINVDAHEILRFALNDINVLLSLRSNFRFVLFYFGNERLTHRNVVLQAEHIPYSVPWQ